MEMAMAADPTLAERVLGRHPFGRLGDPVDDIGPVVRFLLSEDARYVTGATIMADGGNFPIC
jgi:NAD(P)-dependent dehydrogenase (short-subunit alcohol dehydrogenase family)